MLLLTFDPMKNQERKIEKKKFKIQEDIHEKPRILSKLVVNDQNDK